MVLLLMLALAGSDAVKVIVFPLEGPAKTSVSWLGEGIALSILKQIEGRGVQVTDRPARNNLVEALDLPPGAVLSRASMIRVAQHAGTDFVVMGSVSGTEQDLHLSVRVLDVRSLKLSGELASSGPLASLAQMENELAWLVLQDLERTNNVPRAAFAERMRKVPNDAYSEYVQSLGAQSENEQLPLLLKALERYRNFPEAQMLLGRIYFHRGDCGNALPHIELSREDEASRFEKSFIQGTCLLQQDRPIQAVQNFIQIPAAARSVPVLNNLGVAYLRRGNLSEASSALAEARALARTDATVALNLAILRHLQGNDAAARTIVEDAVKSHPKSGMLQFLLGALLKAQGDSEKGAAARAKAKTLGVNVEKLDRQEPKAWTRLLSGWAG